MSRYKYAFYDMDGTVANTCDGIFACTKYAFRKIGAPLDDSFESLRRVIGPPLFYAYTEYFGLSDDEAVRAVELYRERYSQIGIFELELYDGIEKSLEALVKNGVTLAVVSAKPQEFIDRITARFGLDKYFAFNVGAAMNDIDASKERLIMRAIDHFGITKKSDAVMVGDRKYDLDGAENVGIDGIGASYGFGALEELENCKHIYIGNSPKEISEFIIGD